MHDGYVFKDTKHHVDDVELHNMLFDAFYRDLRDIGVEGYKQIRKTKETKIETLKRVIQHYELLEEYERCAFVKQILDKIS